MRDNAAGALLDWYDGNARVLPWRIAPQATAQGQRPDPYRVWLSEIMLQQTTVAAVKGYFLHFTKRWPDVHALASADDADVLAAWAGLGYYARARNLIKCAREVSENRYGVFPDNAQELQELPGIGPYTSAAIASIAFDHPDTVVDGNVERVMARLNAVETPLPEAKPQLITHAEALTPQMRPGDYAQAVMDLGATICTPRTPACGRCPWRSICKARALGIARDLPRKSPKKKKPVRYGRIYVGLRRDGAWLLETRPPTGLLGGMLGWPGTEWCVAPDDAPPAPGEWNDLGAEVRHTFTHFHLRLSVTTALLPEDVVPERGNFVASSKFDVSDLPTLMRKVHAVAAPALNED
ncbi:MAG: A/G-specific adenine glycosylase [Pseudomonadota bacterium]